MYRCMAIIAALFVGLLTSAVPPPWSSRTVATPQDESFYRGQQVQHPEALSGLWEASDGRVGAIGIHLQLDTSVPSEATSLNGVPQSWQDFQVGVFDRGGPTIQIGDQNYFSDSPRGGGV
jgi:hypothetical protein